MSTDRKDWGWDGKFGLFELSGSSRAMRDMNEGASQDDIDFSWQSGMDARDIAAIRKFCQEERLLIIFRCPKPPSLVFHGMFPAKNAHTDEKTSEESGLVTGPSGNIMVSDYDMMCVARHDDTRPRTFVRIRMSAEGQGVKYGRWDPQSAALLRRLNKNLYSRIQHGAQDDYEGHPHPDFTEKSGVPPRAAAFRFVMGGVKAEARVLPNRALTKRFYTECGLDWRYDDAGKYLGPQRLPRG